MYVGDLLDASHLGIRLLTSDRDALGRTLRWTFTTDLPDPSRYIAGGELVITGLVWRRTPDDSEVFIRSVAESGATALAAGGGVARTHSARSRRRMRATRSAAPRCSRHGVVR
ncbi:PucR family transcriptional regulator ligand-binding domain-containing protein [Rhodococcus sp. KRD175]|uniref:PucR family transcriptional regulator ligand-binding domain-containing protein n=1 Tax=Rhodococcus sp. KRD175 TaxID=2729729 RepID=UPI001F494B17|nr:PucR family transcriptional regulator ligand-binding domain-containing protein [Rhodococcus sp. KRD175]